MAEPQNSKSDGSAGRPLTPAETQAAFVAAREASTGANSALREPSPDAKDHYRFDHPAAAHVTVLDREAGTVQPSGRAKIAICGFASSSRHLIPVEDPAWELWGLNQLYRHIPRADRWFDIHRVWEAALVPGTEPGAPDAYREWIRGCGIPFYMVRPEPEMPTTVAFPVTRLIAKFGADYFTSTIAFMVALAIDEIDTLVQARIDGGALDQTLPATVQADIRALYAEHTIGVFGVDLVVGEEYFWQKPCAEFWLGAAAIGRGINVFLPPQTALCKQLYRYGYEAEPDSLIRESEIKSHKKALAAQRDTLLRQIYMADGALQVDEYWEQVAELRGRGADIRI